MRNGLTVGGVAAAAGVTADAVRYYERLKLLSKAERTQAGYRIFDRAEVDRVRAIRRAQTLGLSLSEIRTLFPQDRAGRADCRRVRRLLAEKIAETDDRLKELQHFSRDLRLYLRACDESIARNADGPCPVFAPMKKRP